MSRLIYRVCLIVVLLIAVAGGVYYYTAVYQKEAGPQKGTFVHQEGTIPADKYVSQVPGDCRSYVGRLPEELQQSEKTAEAFVYLNTGKKIPAKAVETGKEADLHGKDRIRFI